MMYNGIPIIDASTRLRNVLVAAGHNMLGLSMGPATGKLVCELISGEPTHVDAAAYGQLGGRE
jgi:D-amino-acid dehydrogenase